MVPMAFQYNFLIDFSTGWEGVLVLGPGASGVSGPKCETGCLGQYKAPDILESIRNQHYPYFSDNQCGPKPHYVFLHDYVFCRLLYPLQNIVMMASIYATVIVAFERYVAVSRPISTYIQDGSDSWRKTFFYIFPMSLFSLAFNFSKFFEYCGTEDRMECPEPTTSYNPTTVHEHGGGNDATKCFYFVYADLTVNGKYHENILA